MKKDAAKIDIMQTEILRMLSKGELPIHLKEKAALQEKRLEIPQEITYRWSGKQTGMPKLSLELRKNTFDEVEQGFSIEEAVLEGKRCFGCESETCIGCGVCVDVCPVGIIYLEHGKGKNGSIYPKQYMIDIGLCMYCGICVEECPTKCLVPTNKYEAASYTKAEFLLDKGNFNDTVYRNFAM